jgi:CHAT domain-containing protein
VTIVSDGVLAYVPFETLSGDAPHQQSLLERFAISYAPSASALASIRTRSGGVALRSKEFIGFADPVYDRPGKMEGERSTTQPATHHAALESELERGFDLTNLPYTRTEVSNIRSLFPVARRQIYLGSEAREEKVKAEKLDDYRYVHFAAHGYIDEQHPRRSGIVLSLNGNEKEDGFLQMHEIMRLKLNADLVTLSACRTGVGTLFRGEGVLGLSRAFFYAGAASVVVSLWNVNDAATAELMKSFYQNLGRGMPKDEALRQAKLALLKSPQRTWHHPYYWAPFVLVGEPN